MSYHDLAKDILEKVGGKENINSVTHCITRLRFQLKDNNKAQTEQIKATQGVVTVVQSGGQYQVVIGNHVPDVYKELVQVSGLQEGAPSNQEEQGEKKGLFSKFIDLISGIFTPVISVLMASGMIKGITSLLAGLNILDKDSGTYLVLQATGDAFFYFFPLFLGYTAAKKFGAKPFLGMTIGGALVYPTLANLAKTTADPLYTLFTGSVFESSVHITFAEIPVILMNYSNSVIPIILAVYFAAKLEKMLNKIIPQVVRGFLVPFFTLIITVPLTFLIIGPIATWAGLLLGNVMFGLYHFSPILAGILVGGFWQVFIMFGLHWGFMPIALNNIANQGYDVIMLAGSATPLATAGVVLGIFLKTKNKKLKEISFPAFLSAVFGITEPALYGVTLPRKKTFIATLAATAIAGAISGFFGSKFFTVGATGVFAIPNAVNPNVGIDQAFIGYVISVAVAFGVGLLLSLTVAYNPKMDEEDTKAPTSPANSPDKEEREKENTRPINAELGENTFYELTSPIAGQVLPLSEIEDEAFALELMGKGAAIAPEKGEVVAPADGVVTTIFPTKHAIGLTTDSGIEMLIHIGMNTVGLKGKYFDAVVTQGDRVKQGQLLVTFDMEQIEAAGYSLVTPVIVSNTPEHQWVEATKEKTVTTSDVLINVVK